MAHNVQIIEPYITCKSGLWQFPPNPERTPKPPAAPAKIAELRAQRQKVRDVGHAKSAALMDSLRQDGASESDVFEQQAWHTLTIRLREQVNRCPMCWHDRIQRCICNRVPPVALQLPVRVLVLMHHKEYYRASDDAKLLLMMLPAAHAKLFIYGKPGDLDALHAEIDEDPAHSMMLWPGDGAQTVEQFVDALPQSSPWRHARQMGGSTAGGAPSASCRPVMKVVVLDAVYRHARTMFRQLVRTRRGGAPLQHVALHPKTLSVYSRAQHGYAQSSAQMVAQSADPEALRICTVEAYALLLTELGEPPEHQKAFVDAVVTNNHALTGEKP